MKFTEKEVSEYCIICGECCRTEGYVFLTEGEAKRIAKYLDMDIYEFTENYCEIVGRKKLALKNREDKQDCIFLKNNRCTIYEVRPEQCINFPYEWSNGVLPEKCIFNV